MVPLPHLQRYIALLQRGRGQGKLCVLIDVTSRPAPSKQDARDDLIHNVFHASSILLSPSQVSIKSSVGTNV